VTRVSWYSGIPGFISDSEFKGDNGRIIPDTPSGVEEDSHHPANGPESASRVVIPV
jgi:hypothetical protein